MTTPDTEIQREKLAHEIAQLKRFKFSKRSEHPWQRVWDQCDPLIQALENRKWTTLDYLAARALADPRRTGRNRGGYQATKDKSNSASNSFRSSMI